MAYRVFQEPKPTRSEPRPPVFGRREHEREAKKSRRTKRIHMAEVAALALGVAGLALYLGGVF